MSCKRENFANFPRKHLFWSLFFNKAAGLKACNPIKNRLQRRRFPLNAEKFLRRLFFIEPLWWLLFIKKTNLLKGQSNRCFSVNTAKFLRKAFFTEHLWWLLLPLYLMQSYLEDQVCTVTMTK